MHVFKGETKNYGQKILGTKGPETRRKVFRISTGDVSRPRTYSGEFFFKLLLQRSIAPN